MDKVKVAWGKSSASKVQEYVKGLEYCLTSPKEDGVFHQATDFVLCRDYLTDALLSAVVGEKRGCYNVFVHDPKSDKPISLDRVRIVLANAADDDLGKKLPAAIEFVNQFEARIHLLRSVAYECETAPEKYKACYLVEGSSRWLLAPPMLSLYTLLLRVGLSHELGTNFDETVDKVIAGKVTPYAEGVVGVHDHKYLLAAQPGIERLTRRGYVRIFHRNLQDNYPDIEPAFMHHRTGIVSFSNRISAAHFPHWYRLEPKKAEEKKGDA